MTKAKQAALHTPSDCKEARISAASILVIDDNTSGLRKENAIDNAGDKYDLCVRLHHVENENVDCVSTSPLPIRVDQHRQGRCRVPVALKLLSDAKASYHDPLVVSGAEYGNSRDFAPALVRRGWRFLLELLPSTRLELNAMPGVRLPASELLQLVNPCDWKTVNVRHPVTSQKVTYLASRIGMVVLPNGAKGQLVIVQTGGIHGVHRGTMFVLASQADIKYKRLIKSVGWARWIKPVLRQMSRPVRQNVIVAERSLFDVAGLRGIPTVNDESVLQENRTNRTLSVVELFAGAGGMGLGFLMANRDVRRYQILYSGEVHPVYVETLRRNHAAYLKSSPKLHYGLVPSECKAIDLRTTEAFQLARSSISKIARLDVLIGGPPCQGFSNSNRNSGHGENPNNRLVDTYVEYVKTLSPKVFIMENVQGILSSAKPSADKPLSVLEYIATELRAAGYLVFPKLIDAAWYGVPQHRQRFFVVGLHTDLGYDKGDFDGWGPFPKPTHGPLTDKLYVTVEDAIRGLPVIGNGSMNDNLSYKPTSDVLAGNDFLRLMREEATPGVITDHITSKHAPYVIERYKSIPTGGNWHDIVELLSNYANVDRTHSNIYRRLTWDAPSITIGHYRKSMLVHPDQDRGLSLREASRLQSFPDWFRFAGADNGENETLGHKQQQLANAVCPLVSMAIADYLYKWITW